MNLYNVSTAFYILAPALIIIFWLLANYSLPPLQVREAKNYKQEQTNKKQEMRKNNLQQEQSAKKYRNSN